MHLICNIFNVSFYHVLCVYLYQSKIIIIIHIFSCYYWLVVDDCTLVGVLHCSYICIIWFFKLQYLGNLENCSFLTFTYTYYNYIVNIIVLIRNIQNILIWWHRKLNFGNRYFHQLGYVCYLLYLLCIYCW